MLISAVLLFSGFFTVSRLSGNDISILYTGYGVMTGVGSGVVYNTVISVTTSWYPDRKGFCSGCLMMAFGFSTLILGNIAGRLIDSSFGWRDTYTLLAFVIGLAVLILGFFVKPASDDAFPSVSGNAAESGRSDDLSPEEMLARPSFWMLFVFFILLAAVGSTAISFAKDFFLLLGAEGDTAVAIVGILSVFNGIGRLCSGALFDALGIRKTQFITSAVAIIAPLCALMAVILHSFPLGAAGLCLCGFSYGFCPTASAAFVGEFYGRKHFAVNFSLLNLILIPASFASTISGAMISSSGSYISTFVMLTAFSVCGLVINVFIKKP